MDYIRFRCRQHIKLSNACPNQPETFNGFQDADGCPDTITQPDLNATGIDYLPAPINIVPLDSLLPSLGITSNISQLDPNAPLFANFTISNIGSQSVTGPYLANFTVSPYEIAVVGSTYIFGTGAPVFSNQIPGPSPLTPSTSSSVVSPIDIGNATCGLFVLNATADSTFVISEEKENNNSIRDLVPCS